jgi:DNA-binding transcriptional MerR regulator
MDDPARPVFGISVAAELSGTAIQNLRVYERRGLLKPDRTDGGTRRYSQDDVDTLVHIRGLIDDGLNLAGVSRVLELEAEILRLEGKLNRLRM